MLLMFVDREKKGRNKWRRELVSWLVKKNWVRSDVALIIVNVQLYYGMTSENKGRLFAWNLSTVSKERRKLFAAPVSNQSISQSLSLTCIMQSHRCQWQVELSAGLPRLFNCLLSMRRASYGEASECINLRNSLSANMARRCSSISIQMQRR